jgi:hypothetical protein
MSTCKIYKITSTVKDNLYHIDFSESKKKSPDEVINVNDEWANRLAFTLGGNLKKLKTRPVWATIFENEFVTKDNIEILREIDPKDFNTREEFNNFKKLLKNNKRLIQKT